VVLDADRRVAWNTLARVADAQEVREVELAVAPARAERPHVVLGEARQHEQLERGGRLPRRIARHAAPNFLTSAGKYFSPMLSHVLLMNCPRPAALPTGAAASGFPALSIWMMRLNRSSLTSLAECVGH
jgi:hypothetical protein